MNTVGKFLRERRKAKGLSMREVAEQSSISHTEVCRIESGERAFPSIRVLTALGKVLGIPDDEILRLAGYKSDEDDDVPLMEKVFPELKTEKLQNTAQRIIDGLARNNDLESSQYDDLVNHMEMWMDFAKKNRNSKKTKVQSGG